MADTAVVAASPGGGAGLPDLRSYRMYVDRLESEERHKEVVRLHGHTLAALEAARQSEERYALAAAGSNDGLWDWDVRGNTLCCSERWKLMIGLSPLTK